eukprot:42858-Eustigmatos_ZCMA.PRE.1
MLLLAVLLGLERWDEVSQVTQAHVTLVGLQQRSLSACLDCRQHEAAIVNRVDPPSNPMMK